MPPSPLAQRLPLARFTPLWMIELFPVRVFIPRGAFLPFLFLDPDDFALQQRDTG